LVASERKFARELRAVALGQVEAKGNGTAMVLYSRNILGWRSKDPEESKVTPEAIAAATAMLRAQEDAAVRPVPFDEWSRLYAPSEAKRGTGKAHS